MGGVDRRLPLRAGNFDASGSTAIADIVSRVFLGAIGRVAVAIDEWRPAMGRVGFWTMSRRQQDLYKPADLSYFIGELRRLSGPAETGSHAGNGSRAHFWHAVRLYLQGRIHDSAFRIQGSAQE